MRAVYVEPGANGRGSCIVDLIEAPETVSPEGGYVLTRIRTTPPDRGQGLARRLMRQVLDDADRENVPLLLTVQPYDDALDERELGPRPGPNASRGEIAP